MELLKLPSECGKHVDNMHIISSFDGECRETQWRIPRLLVGSTMKMTNLHTAYGERQAQHLELKIAFVIPNFTLLRSFIKDQRKLFTVVGFYCNLLT